MARHEKDREICHVLDGTSEPSVLVVLQRFLGLGCRLGRDLQSEYLLAFCDAQPQETPHLTDILG